MNEQHYPYYDSEQHRIIGLTDDLKAMIANKEPNHILFNYIINCPAAMRIIERERVGLYDTIHEMMIRDVYIDNNDTLDFYLDGYPLSSNCGETDDFFDLLFEEAPKIERKFIAKNILIEKSRALYKYDQHFANIVNSILDDFTYPWADDEFIQDSTDEEYYSQINKITDIIVDIYERSTDK